MSVVGTTFTYWNHLTYYWFRGGSFSKCPYLTEPSQRQARIQLFSLTLIAYLWNKPHYRHPTFAHDMRANLLNVAIPGTGVPLSIFCYFKFTACLFIAFMIPICCFFGAVNVARKSQNGSFWNNLATAYHQHLLYPDDWFSYWRLNCRLASWYWLVTKEAGYDMENKWAFTERCDALGIPISPSLNVDAICVKHKNEEGGLGIHFFKNALKGGDWLIQPKLDNYKTVASLLPKNAPLSTFRVMTASRLGITSRTDDDSGDGTAPISAVSCVFRAGREGSATDHDSILFDVDVPGKKLGVGTTNMHWYQLGLNKVLSTSWLNNSKYTHHPDGNIPVTGKALPEMETMINTCVNAHEKLFPGVPIAGWDLCVIEGEPRMCLLEVNLMCNFFKGSFDKEKYFLFMEDYFKFLESSESSSKKTL